MRAWLFIAHGREGEEQLEASKSLKILRHNLVSDLLARKMVCSLRRSKMRTMQGFTLMEMLVVVALVSVFTAIGVVNLRKFSRPSESTSSIIQSYFKTVRAKAISQTRAYKIAPTSDTIINVTTSLKCSDPAGSFVAEPKYRLNMPSGSKLISPSWSVCYNSRGIADSNIHIYLQANDGVTKHLEVLLGGAVKVRP